MSTVKCQNLRMTSANKLWFESITCFLMRPLICVNVITLCEDALPLSNLLEIPLQKGSVLCMSLRVSFLFSARGRGMFTMSLVDGLVGSAGVVLAVLCILLWVWVAAPSGVDVINILIDTVGIAGGYLTSTSHDRQSAGLLWAPDIHLKLIL